MSKLKWDQSAERIYETGVKYGVLFVSDGKGGYKNGVAWNGLTAVNESPSGGEPNAFYADDLKYLNIMSVEELGLGVEAYTYPDEFGECDGSAYLDDSKKGVVIGQQKRKPFALCYRTTVGNDVDENDYGYKIHIAYGCLASPSEKGYSTINDSPEPITFSWDVSTTPVPVSIEGKNFKPTSLVTITSTDFKDGDKTKLEAIENKLYGTEREESTLLMPEDIYKILVGE